MAYYFFIGDMMLPVPPAKMNVKVNNKNKTINLINEGEVNIIKTQGLTEIYFDARLPNQNYPFADYDTSFSSSLTSQLTGSNFSFKKADYFLDNFKTSKLSNLPVRLIITRMRNWQMLFDTNMLVTLEDYGIDEDADNGFDLVVPLKFKQYRPYGTKECEVTTDENGVQHISVKETRPAYDKTVPNAYKIRNEQSMWEVCKRVSGGSLDWREVMQKNSITNPLGQMQGKVITF